MNREMGVVLCCIWSGAKMDELSWFMPGLFAYLSMSGWGGLGASFRSRNDAMARHSTTLPRTCLRALPLPTYFVRKVSHINRMVRKGGQNKKPEPWAEQMVNHYRTRTHMLQFRHQ